MISGRINIRRHVGTACILASLFALSACGGETGKILGLDRQTPDEFAVVTRAPLT
ncbi:MAG: DUF3035 domain-containing protein, partial [Alphaproteobacteria bacterium]|nr:DUF3035 domain-containing protein [Alphaproteobacteria bacterium]